jgi:drug/metabolite transporter (DMT)-like permease
MNSLGALAALGSSVTWAFATSRYAKASASVGSLRINLARSLVVFPLFVAGALILHGRALFSGVGRESLGWLFVSVICSYAFADNLFLMATRRIGVSSALSIASTFPLWAALVAVLRGEPLGASRGLGTVLCVVGVVWVVRLSSSPDENTKKHDAVGLLLAFTTSVLWAGNAISTKLGSLSLDGFQANSLRYAIALMLLVPTVLAARPAGPKRPPEGWLWVVPAILADAFLGSFLYVYGLVNTSTAVGATLTSLSPLISVPFAIWAGTERWNRNRFLAICITVAGITLLVRE